MLNALKKVIKKRNLIIDETVLEQQALEYMEKIKTGSYNFSNYHKQVLTQGKKKRNVYSYSKASLEYTICAYLKNELDRDFRIRYPNRNKIMNMLFNVLPVVKDLNDFVIVRFDFKSFFDSVLTEHVYEKYIRGASIPRKNKIVLEDLIKHFKYCYAGLNISNTLTEIICRDFDKVLRAKLERYGVVYCERYVDDALIIMNSYIAEADFRALLKGAIKEVFGDCKIEVNQNKFYYIARRSIAASQLFDFLGYNFILEYSRSNNKETFAFKFGITEKKQRKFKARIKQTFIEYKRSNNLELLRHRIKAFSTRVVYSIAFNDKSYDWIAKGIISNYNELRYHLDSLDSSTESFLKNIYFEIMDELRISYPYFFNKNDVQSIYNLYSTIERNRSMIFDEKIGLRINQLVALIRKLDPSYNANKKKYYQIANDYLELLKIQ